MTENTRVAVIGQGDMATGLADVLRAAGIDVVGFDPDTTKNAAVPAGIDEAKVDVDLVFSLGPPSLAFKVAAQIAPLLTAGTVYADLNSGTPGMKKKLADLFPDGCFVDVTASLQEAGSPGKVTMTVAGTGAQKLIELLGSTELTLEYISDVAGDAAAREILSSLLEKSMAAALIDFLWAAESLGQKDWAYQEVIDEFNDCSAETAKWHLAGTAQHLKRRQIEMMDVVETMRETGYDSTLVAAVETNYSRILHGKRIPFSKSK